jgi:hypothetical protein
MENNTLLQKENIGSTDKLWSKSFFIRTLLNGLLLVLPTIIILIFTLLGF